MEQRPTASPDAPEETLLAAASAGDMTGLIPSGRPDEGERTSYQDLFPWLPPHAAPQI